jgi:uncharacterized protein YecE (DUF72 family)
MSRLFIGTSGWSYAHWARSVFYPDGLSQSKWLQYYVKFFNAVELNVTFYRLVQKKTFQNWYKRTPKNFSFVAKGSRFITHIKRLKMVKKEVKLFMDNATGLKEKLACILWQLPPGLKKDLKRLESVLRLLKIEKLRQVFEFRNTTWFDKEVYSLLKDYNASLCIAHSGRFPCVKEITADFIYLRFHGGGSLYSSNYSDNELKEWAVFVKQFVRKDIFAFFNNDAYGYAVKNALRFRELLEKS